MRYWLAIVLTFLTGVALAIPAKDVPTNLAVVDLAGVMSAQEKETLESQLRQINQAGTMQAAVVIVPSTDGVDLFDYGMSLADRWKLGDAQKDNGLLLLVAVKDRKLRFLQGYGLEGDLPDIALKSVIRDNITPYFKQGEYAQGISAGITRIHQALTGEGLPLPKTPEGSYDDDGGFDLGFIPFLLVVVMAWARGLAKQFGKLQTWLGLSGLGGLVMLFMLGISVQTLVYTAILSGVLLVVLLVATALPASSGRRGHSNGHTTIGGGGWRSGGSSSGGWSSYSGGGGGFGGGGAGGSW